MTVGELIAELRALDPAYPVRLRACLGTSEGQVFFSEGVDTVLRPVNYGENAGAVVLCNWLSPVVHLSDLRPVA